MYEGLQVHLNTETFRLDGTSTPCCQEHNASVWSIHGDSSQLGYSLIYFYWCCVYSIPHYLFQDILYCFLRKIRKMSLANDDVMELPAIKINTKATRSYCVKPHTEVDNYLLKAD